jgi:hypothetical protein
VSLSLIPFFSLQRGFACSDAESRVLIRSSGAQSCPCSFLLLLMACHVAPRRLEALAPIGTLFFPEKCLTAAPIVMAEFGKLL